ncbi:nitroreductase [uncultured Pseudoteredinibacter sp.]|uniref:nitroreductase n=1 Tax=uncultured Pseudoteredinibacter sp. TaxID=1641701 RepID=UPI00261B940D|nr:nitroreductase [uncultured Pseudoteredinibacter sp.]
MDTIDAIKTRISTRAFLDTPISQAEVEEILDIARFSPSSSNLQPWGTVVLAGDSRKAATDLALNTLMKNPAGEADEFPVYPENLPQKYQDRSAGVGKAMYELMGIERQDEAARQAWAVDNFNFYGAPVAIFFTIDRVHGRNQWASLGMFMQTVCLVAHAKGYGTCMQEIWAMVRNSLHSHLQLDDKDVIYAGLALGHPDKSKAVNSLRTEREAVSSFSQFIGF